MTDRMITWTHKKRTNSHTLALWNLDWTKFGRGPSWMNFDFLIFDLANDIIFRRWPSTQTTRTRITNAAARNQQAHTHDRLPLASMGYLVTTSMNFRKHNVSRFYDDGGSKCHNYEINICVKNPKVVYFFPSVN